MKKSLLLISSLLLLASCGDNQNSSSVSTSDSSSTSESTSSSESSSSSSSLTHDVTTITENDNVVSIERVISKPEYVFIGDVIEPSKVVICLKYSDGRIVNENPDYIEINYQDLNDGDTAKAVVHYQDLTIDFDISIRAYSIDIIDSDFVGGIKSYTPWKNSSSTNEAKYSGLNSTKNGALQFSGGVTAGKPGIVSTFSGGLLKKVKINWNEDTSSGRIFGLYGKNTPFYDNKDLSNLSDCDLIHNFTYNPDNASDEFTINEDYYYFAFIANGALLIDSIEINWNKYTTIPTLKSLSFEGYLTATTNDESYNSDNFTILGHFSNGLEANITRFCDIEFKTNIPELPNENYEVLVNATYKRNIEISFESNVKAIISQGYPTPLKFYFPTVYKGGTIITSGFKEDNDKGFYVQNAGADTMTSFEIANDTLYWEKSPTSISVVATIGGSSSLSFDEEHGVYIELLDINKETIEGTKKLVFTSSTRAEVDFTINYENVDNVAGVRITHKKLSGKNVRIFGITISHSID